MPHKHEADGFLERLGRRVRMLRVDSGRSIRELAEQAELSPRFLSELEAGRGNISVARLARIADALGQPLPSVLPVNTTNTSLRGRVWEMVASATSDDLEELRLWFLDRQQQRSRHCIALVGVRGAGKSTIGKMLARRGGIPFVEFDAMLEKEAGISLVEMFAIHGEGYYRQLQHDVMQRFLATAPRVVLATGGSLVTDRETWGMVRRHCHTVWLRASAKDHWDRVAAQGDVRPLRNPGAMDELKGLLRSREPLYSQAELTIDTSRHSLGESVALIQKTFGEQTHSKRVRPARSHPSAR
jgi:XRE family aerobic/anaerobic benzoate catabolism transcriptional regulator